jgi:hypothetical protein
VQVTVVVTSPETMPKTTVYRTKAPKQYLLGHTYCCSTPNAASVSPVQPTYQGRSPMIQLGQGLTALPNLNGIQILWSSIGVLTR